MPPPLLSPLSPPLHGPSLPTAEPASNARHPGGRPTTCTESNLGMICQGISEGLCDTAAAALIGVPASTLSRWKKERPSVVDCFAAAREKYRSTLLQKLHRAQTRDGRPDWRAAAWLLERVFPEDYGRKRQASSGDMPSMAACEPPPSTFKSTLPPGGFAAWKEARRREKEEQMTTPSATSETSETETEELTARNPNPCASGAETAAPARRRTDRIDHIDPRADAAAAVSSETSETPRPEPAPSSASDDPACETSSDSAPHSGLSRRERRHRAHLQRRLERKTHAAQRRTAGETAAHSTAGLDHGLSAAA